ncbi:MAG TPA: fumarylacetoacetate hydrolase family protein [Terriglobales bacterium]|jgi:2-keto-4-pentenoate hydratase/2-oxohepta-3-ene-1,7-dioic acid hydratase in catechol pathway|nr:fumarylacetoacetate hydrolase family protein [Terriglobales bacterium]
MRLVTFLDKNSRQHIGAIAPDGRIVELAAAHSLLQRENPKAAAAHIPADMRLLFEGGDRSLDAARAALDFAIDQQPDAGPQGEPVFYRREDVHVKAPIIPKKFFHTAGNFREHHHEAEKAGFSHPVLPWIVFFQNVDAIIGPDEPVIFPPHLTQELDYELELAVVLKKAGKHFTPEDAEQYIGGYVIFNDITARDIQRQEMKSGVFSFCKGIDSFCPLGPHIATADEIKAPHNLAMELRVNGEVRQRSHSSKMSVTIPEILAHYSAMGYSAGDVVSTGTVSGVAAFSADPKAWFLKPGDVMECEIEQIGVLRNPVISWEEAYGEKLPSLTAEKQGAAR